MLMLTITCHIYLTIVEVARSLEVACCPVAHPGCTLAVWGDFDVEAAFCVASSLANGADISIVLSGRILPQDNSTSG